MKYDIGDIVHAKIEFADRNISANRFLLIIEKDEAVALYEGVNLTTKDKSFLESSVYIYKDKENNLSFDSYAKMDTIYSFDEGRIHYKKGSLKQVDLDLVLAKKQQLQEQNKLIKKHLHRVDEKSVSPDRDAFFMKKKKRHRKKDRDELER